MSRSKARVNITPVVFGTFINIKVEKCFFPAGVIPYNLLNAELFPM
jgi:hypothetical protein